MLCSKSVAHGRRSSRLQVELLEDRAVPAVIADPVGDFLPFYSGERMPGLDVVEHEAVYLQDTEEIVFYGKMDGSIADTQPFGGVYIIGVDRGTGTPRFRGRTPEIGPNVVWDSVVRINPDGTGLFNNIINNTQMTTLTNITINGNEFTARVPLSVMLPNSTRPPEEWTYNLWPRNSVVIGNNAAVPDLAPDDGNSPVQTIAPVQASVVVNDGDAQRSMVNSVTVTFDGAVTLDDGAFALSRADGSLVDLNLTAELVNGQTVVVLTFSGPDIVAGSLADGSYTLSIAANLVHDRWGRELDGDGDGDGGGDRTDAFHRLLGDGDGDHDVDWADRDLFRSAFNSAAGDEGYLWYCDFDGDLDVDGWDNGQFNRWFGQY
jgi:hypothetical protein